MPHLWGRFHSAEGFVICFSLQIMWRKSKNPLAPLFLSFSPLVFSLAVSFSLSLSFSTPSNPQHCFFSPPHILWWAFKLVKFMLENPTNTARHTQSPRAFAFEFRLKSEMEWKLLSEFTQEENIKREFKCFKKKKKMSINWTGKRAYLNRNAYPKLTLRKRFQCYTPFRVPGAGFLNSSVAVITWLCSWPGGNWCIRVCTKVYTNVYYRCSHKQASLSPYSKI